MKPFTTFAVVLFSAIAVVHLVRLFTDWQVTITGFVVPRWWSLPGAVIAGGLALMVRRESRGTK